MRRMSDRHITMLSDYEIILEDNIPVVISNSRFTKTTKLKPFLHNGYLQVHLYHNRQRIQKTIHSLVADKYLGPCPAGMEINHKDGNKLNNHPSNLEYVTHKENIRHAVRTNLWGNRIKDTSTKAEKRRKAHSARRLKKLSYERYKDEVLMTGTPNENF